MKIVITGALGHIGSKLTRLLPAMIDNLEIVMVDNLSTQRISSLFNLPSNVRYKFIEADVVKKDMHPILEGSDAVIHLAALTDAASSVDNKEEVEYNNYRATENIARACLEVNTSLIHISSTSVYGTQKSKVDEDCSIDDLNPQSPYAATKLREEDLLQSLKNEKGLSVVTCRFGTIFGTSPGMRFHTAVNKFCWQAVMGLPLTVWQTAYDQKRPYLDLDDAIRIIEFIINNKLFNGNVYNIVTINTTVKDIIKIINIYVDNVQIEYVASKIMNQLSYDVSNLKIISEGFSFNGDLRKGIQNTISLIKNANL